MSENVTNKEILMKIYDKVEDLSKTSIKNTEHLRAIDMKASETNGQIAKAQKEIHQIKLDMEMGDNQTYLRSLKMGGIALIASSFIFIKESRDIILDMLRALL